MQFCHVDLAKCTIFKILLSLFGSLPLKKRAKLRFFFDIHKFIRANTRA